MTASTTGYSDGHTTGYDIDIETRELLSIAELQRHLRLEPMGEGRKIEPVGSRVFEGGQTQGWGATPVVLSGVPADRLRPAPIRTPLPRRLRPNAEPTIGTVLDRRGGRGSSIGPLLSVQWRTPPRVLVGSLFGGSGVTTVATALATRAAGSQHPAVLLRTAPEAGLESLARLSSPVTGWDQAATLPDNEPSVVVACGGQRLPVIVGRDGEPRPSLSLVARIAEDGRRAGALVVMDVAHGVAEVRRALATQHADLLVLCCRRNADELRLTGVFLRQLAADCLVDSRKHAVVAVTGIGGRWRLGARSALACLSDTAAGALDLDPRSRRIDRPPDGRPVDRLLAAAVLAADNTLRRS